MTALQAILAAVLGAAFVIQHLFLRAAQSKRLDALRDLHVEQTRTIDAQIEAIKKKEKEYE